jgi:Mlc titration factor MtfA (ptsG expression regulator)
MMVIWVVLLLVVVAYLWLRKKNGKSMKAGEPVADYKALLQADIAYYQQLDEAGKVRFEDKVQLFLADTHIEGVGTEVTDADKVMIASSAVIPVFGFPEWRYRNLTNVILYPDTFDQEFQFEGEDRNILGMVGSGYMNGQMLLSRAALVKGFSRNNGKENTAIHEFVHLLDASDGATDGVPENLIKHEYAVPWLHMMHREMQRIEQGRSDINPYALTNQAEFLAVASEYFFEKPEQFKVKHAELYGLLSGIFGQDPAAG